MVDLTGKLPYSYGGPGLRLISFEPTALLSGVAASAPDTAPTPLVGQNISVTAGSLGLTGYLEYNYGGPGLRLIGYEPSVAIESAGLIEEPGTGSLALTGAVPDVTTTANHFIDVDAGSITITGAVPLVSTSASNAPGTGSLTLTGAIPTLDQTFNHIRAPPTGSLPLAGIVPSLYFGRAVEPSAGSLSLTGHAPSVTPLGPIVEPGISALALTGYLSYNYGGPGLRLIGYEPLAVLESNIVSPSTGALTLTGLVPFLPANQDVEPGTGTLALTGQVPVPGFTGDHTAAITSTSALALSGLAPVTTVSTDVISPEPGSLTLTGLTPAVESRADVVAEPPAGSLELTGYIEYNYGGPGLRLIGFEPEALQTTIDEVLPGAGSLVLESHAPALEITLFPAVFDLLVLTGALPFAAVTANHLTEPGTGSLALGGHAPSVTVTDNPVIPIDVPVPDAAINLQGHIPAVTYDWVVFPDTGALTLIGYPFTIDTVIGPIGTGSLSLTTYAPTIQQSVPIGELTLTGLQPQITILGLLPVPIGSLALTGHAPVVSAPTEEEEPEQPSGGWEFWEDFERELERRKKARLKRIRAREKAKKIAERLDRELALAERKLEEEDARKDELERIARLVDINRPAIEQMGSDRLEFVMREALEQQTFSKLERLERELTQMREEEMFLLMATQILINE